MSGAGFVHIREVMEHVRSGKPFSISWVTADRRRRTGGKIKHLINAVITEPKASRSKSTETIKSEGKIWESNPNHYANDTINVRKMGTENITKIHPMLITVFNGRPVAI